MRHLTWVNVGPEVVALFQLSECTLVMGQSMVTHPTTLEEDMWLEIVVTALDYFQVTVEGIGLADSLKILAT